MEPWAVLPALEPARVKLSWGRGPALGLCTTQVLLEPHRALPGVNFAFRDLLLWLNRWECLSLCFSVSAMGAQWHVYNTDCVWGSLPLPLKSKVTQWHHRCLTDGETKAQSNEVFFLQRRSGNRTQVP